MTVEYHKITNGEVWWCNAHRRQATHVCEKTGPGYIDYSPCCDPAAPGIMLPCECVNLTGICEINEN